MDQNNTTSQKKLLKAIRPQRVIWPVLIGFAVIIFLLSKEFKPDTFASLEFSILTVFWILIALMMMALRDFGYMARLRILTEKEFSWRKTFRIIMLWEFTSALTPSAIGGTSFAILYLNKEGLSLGRSSAVVMATSFLDELYFIIMLPLILLFLDWEQLFLLNTDGSSPLMSSLLLLVLGAYLLKLAYLIFLSYGLFRNPRGLKWLLLWLFKMPILRKWKQGANQAGTDIVESSRDLKKKNYKFWMKAFLASFCSWTARYWVVNSILMAFWCYQYNTMDHIMIFARQLLMWIMMLISPTPGGSGFSEWVFTQYLGDFIPEAGLAIGLALIWRLISYYPYLFIGMYLLPKWIKKNFNKKNSA